MEEHQTGRASLRRTRASVVRATWTFDTQRTTMTFIHSSFDCFSFLMLVAVFFRLLLSSFSCLVA